MEINVLIEEDFEGCPEAGWLGSVAEQVLIAEKAGADVELGLVIAGQERVRGLNKTYLGEDAPTDVLAFSSIEEPMVDSPPFIHPPDGVRHLGEVLISYPQAVTQAEEHRHPVKREIAILIIHGVLHLLGYDHDEAERERQMRTREAEILSYVAGQKLVAEFTTE